jgi:hypothetical protein
MHPLPDRHSQASLKALVRFADDDDTVSVKKSN